LELAAASPIATVEIEVSAAVSRNVRRSRREPCIKMSSDSRCIELFELSRLPSEIETLRDPLRSPLAASLEEFVIAKKLENTTGESMGVAFRR
jgi:hypothetical protein